MKKYLKIFGLTVLIFGGVYIGNSIDTSNKFSLADLVQSAYAQQEACVTLGSYYYGEGGPWGESVTRCYDSFGNLCGAANNCFKVKPGEGYSDCQSYSCN